eukprot:Gb_41477 [translate_table: standard]
MALQGAALATRTPPLGGCKPSTRKRGNASSQLQAGQGLRLPADKYALKSAFTNGAVSSLQLLPQTDGASPPRITMRVTSKQAYICRDCGYIYNDRTPFEKLPDKFFCPVCGAPKRRFKPYDVPVAKNVNNESVRKARKEQLKKDSTLGNALPVAIIIGIAGLVGTYFYLNSQF